MAIINSSPSSTAISYAAAVTAAGPTQPQPPAKYVPVHRRAAVALAPSDVVDSHRSPSPTPSDASSTSTLVCTDVVPSTKSRVYSITTLLHLAHDPEIKPISLAQREKLRETVPEIVMNRRTRKALEYHAIQERVRAKAQLAVGAEDQTHIGATAAAAAPPHPHSISDASPVTVTKVLSHQRQRPGMRRQPRSGAERRKNVVEATSWRTFRIPSLATV